MRLALLRHTRPLVPAAQVYGRSEVPVDPRRDAAAADDALRELGGVRLVVTSPRLRCRGLADLLAAGLQVPLRVDPRLQEVDLGAWEGRSWAAVPRDELDAWVARFIDHRPGGGESTRELLTRVGAALADWRSGTDDALWVTHAGVIRAVDLLRAGITAPTAAQWPQRPVPYGGCEWIQA